MRVETTDVLVVGAGPAGLAATALLARAGVRSITVTKYATTADSPRAHLVNQRSVEIFRDLGLEERVKARALPQSMIGTQPFATSFAGPEISRMMVFGGGRREHEYRRSSPTEMCNAPQHILEPIMLDGAREHGGDVRFEHEVITVSQTEGDARALVRDRRDGTEQEIRAQYIVGCDGARSVVAEQGGFSFEGDAGLGDAITVWIEADLTRFAKHRSGALFFVCNPGSDDVFSIWTCVEPWTEWSTIFVQHRMTPIDLTPEAVLAKVRRAVGDPDVDVRIKKISPWQINNVVAERYRRGRLFLAGDAAHRHPPANGLGLNTSIQDSYNLAWKLALVLQGHAGENLLDSYHDERRPEGRKVVTRAIRSVFEMAPYVEALGFEPGQTEAEAMAIVDHIHGPDGEEQRHALLAAMDVMHGQFLAHGVEMGQRYASGAVVDDGIPFPEPDGDPDLHHRPTTHPGAPIPHVWLERDRTPRSTLDLCGYDRFTLITGIDSTDWQDAAATVSAELGVEVRAIAVGMGRPDNDVLGDWTRSREIADTGCLLVRPDRIVAWRCAERVVDPTAALREALSRVLSVRVTAGATS